MKINKLKIYNIIVIMSEDTLVKTNRKEYMKEYMKKYRKSEISNGYYNVICDICNGKYKSTNRGLHLNTKKHKFALLEKELNEIKNK